MTATNTPSSSSSRLANDLRAGRRPPNDWGRPPWRSKKGANPMTLVEQTRTALSAVPTFAGGGHTLVVEHDGLRLSCDLTALDSLACEFTRFALRAEKLATASIQELKRVSETLAARLTYL